MSPHPGRSDREEAAEPWLPLSLLWTANTLETVTGFEAVALLVVPIEFSGVFVARTLMGAVAKGLGVRQPAATDVFSFTTYCHWVWAAPRSFDDSCHSASVQMTPPPAR